MNTNSNPKHTTPIIIPKIALPNPCFVLCFFISYIAQIPNIIANGANTINGESKPQYPAAIAHHDLPTGNNNLITASESSFTTIFGADPIAKPQLEQNFFSFSTSFPQLGQNNLPPTIFSLF